MIIISNFKHQVAVIIGTVAIALYFTGKKASHRPQVRTQYGIIEGTVVNTHFGPNTGVEQFLGIPYALPPVGDIRFEYPKPPENYQNGVLDASTYPNICLHKQDYGLKEPMSEDCLFLNVYRPIPIRENRAVMVWIHGGAFISMYTYEGYPQTNNATTLAFFGDVIVVTIHYRLAIFGSLHTGDNRIKGGNFGLKDQQMALRWIHENIRDFNGDPNLVTIFGESAGGHSVSNHLFVPGNEKLFARAVIQSGSSTSYRGCLSMDYITQNIEYVSRKTRCPDDKNFIQCLRNIPALDLMKQSWPGENILKIPHIPAADGESIIQMPIDLLKNGKVHTKDILIGMNRNEGTMYVDDMIPGVTFQTIENNPESAYYRAVEELVKERDLQQSDIEAIRKHYKPMNPVNLTETWMAIGDLYGDLTYKCSIQEVAKEYNRLGMKVYQYYLNYRASRDTNPEWMGVGHTEDIQWVFGHPFDLSRGYTEEEKHLSRDVMTWWTNFAKYGHTMHNWKPYSCEGPSYLRIDGPGQYPIFTNSSVDREKCQLWGY